MIFSWGRKCKKSLNSTYVYYHYFILIFTKNLSNRVWWPADFAAVELYEYAAEILLIQHKKKQKLNYLSPHIVTSLIQTGFNLFAHFCWGGALGLWSSNIRIWELRPRCWNSHTKKVQIWTSSIQKHVKKTPVIIKRQRTVLSVSLSRFWLNFPKSCPVFFRSFKTLSAVYLSGRLKVSNIEI